MICSKCPFAVWCLAHGRPPNAAKVCPTCHRVWLRRKLDTDTYRNRYPQIMWWRFRCPKIVDVVYIGQGHNNTLLPGKSVVRTNPDILAGSTIGGDAGARGGGLDAIKCPNCVNNIRRSSANRSRVSCGDLDDPDHVWGLRLFMEDDSGLS